MINRLLYRSSLRFQLGRKLGFIRSIDFLKNNKIEGSFIEFGVGKGTTMKIAMEVSHAKKYGFTEAIGVDTFSGFPETAGPESKHEHNPIVTSSRKFSQESVQSYLGSRLTPKLIAANMELESLLPVSLSKIALVHCDLDLSSPTLNALRQIENYLQVGTVLMFDNFFFFRGNTSLGEQLAISQFLKRSKVELLEFFTYSWHGKAFIVSGFSE